MKIALDFDDTYTTDEVFWAGFVRDATERGHDVRFVTARVNEANTSYNDDIKAAAKMLGIAIIYTEYSQKAPVCNHLGWEPDIWIDDHPLMIPSEEAMSLVVS